MAKSTTALATAPTQPNSILTKPPTDSEAAALAVLDEAGITSDGLDEVGVADMRTPLKLYNLKRAENALGKVTQDTFFDTIDRTVSPVLNLVLLDVHKTNLYAAYNKTDQRNVTMCSSFDRVTGHWSEDGHARPCRNCPDAQWRTDPEGKRMVPCSEVWNVGAFDLDAQRVVLIKFKKTSLDAIRVHLQAHHLGRRPMPGGKRGNIPLFAYRVRVTIAMHKSGNYALPSIELGDMLSAPDIKVMHDTCQGLRATFEARMQMADASAAGTGEGGDTSFDPSGFGHAPEGNRGSEGFVDG